MSFACLVNEVWIFTSDKLVLLFAVELLFQPYVPETLFLFKAAFSPPFPRRVACAGEAMTGD